MVTYLGYEYLDKYNAYNVMVCYPVTKDNATGCDVAKVYVKPDTFDLQFKDVAIGSVLPMNVTYQYMQLKQPLTGQYKPIFTL